MAEEEKVEGTTAPVPSISTARQTAAHLAGYVWDEDASMPGPGGHIWDYATLDADKPIGRVYQAAPGANLDVEVLKPMRIRGFMGQTGAYMDPAPARRPRAQELVAPRMHFPVGSFEKAFDYVEKLCAEKTDKGT